MNPTVSRDYAAWVRVGRGLLYVGPGRNTLIEPAEKAEVAERASLAEALRRPGPEPSRLDATEAAIAEAEEVTAQVERGASILRMLVQDPDPATVAKEVDRLLATLNERYREGRFRDVLRLARVLVSILLLAQRWRDLVWTLGLAKEAALALEDVAAEAWALHELGTLNIAAGNSGAATELLGSAGELFEAAGDPEAAELTSQNLQQIAAIAPPPGMLDRIAEWSASHKAVILIAGAIALAGGVAGAFAVIDGDGDGEPGQTERRDAGRRDPDGGTRTARPGRRDDGRRQPADADGDGVADSDDNCPTTSNPEQEDRDELRTASETPARLTSGGHRTARVLIGCALEVITYTPEGATQCLPVAIRAWGPPPSRSNSGGRPVVGCNDASWRRARADRGISGTRPGTRTSRAGGVGHVGGERGHRSSGLRRRRPPRHRDGSGALRRGSRVGLDPRPRPLRTGRALPWPRALAWLVSRVERGAGAIEYEADELIATDDHVISKSDMRGRGRTSGVEVGRLCMRFACSGTGRSSGSHGSPAAPTPSKPPGLRSRRCRRRTWKPSSAEPRPLTAATFDALLEEFDPEVEWHPAILTGLGREAAVYRGHEGVRKGIRGVYQALGETHPLPGDPGPRRSRRRDRQGLSRNTPASRHPSIGDPGDRPEVQLRLHAVPAAGGEETAEQKPITPPLRRPPRTHIGGSHGSTTASSTTGEPPALPR